ncbi:MAP3K epsilon protein kinase 1, partial [Acropora cervicornis]
MLQVPAAATVATAQATGPRTAESPCLPPRTGAASIIQAVPRLLDPRQELFVSDHGWRCIPVSVKPDLGELISTYVEEEMLALDLARNGNVKEIVKYYGAKLEGRKAFICMEYMEGGTLQQHIERQKEKLPVIAEETCFVFVRDILKGLAFLNSKGLVHGDIK